MKFAPLFVLVLVACSTSTTRDDADGDDDGTTTGVSALTGGSSGGGGTGGGSTGGTTGPAPFSPSSNQPTQSATYRVQFAPDPNYTTCAASNCDGAFTVAYKLEYAGAGTYIVSTDTSSWSADVETIAGHLALSWETTVLNRTSQAGCPATRSGRLIMGLLPHQVAGAYHSYWNAQACNGYQEYSCTCAYTFASDMYINAHKLTRELSATIQKN